ncbi:hypothetical protein [Bradyrhizobium sp. 2TAF24]|uniref:hypothetical protein n=1 Tax=Bradyrhizobium sp. 2TAF24 TaxID=3233011 RepID=UPI003F90B613
MSVALFHTSYGDGVRTRIPIAAMIAVCVLWAGSASAMEPCAVLAPGADGVLRLDGGAGGRAAGCGAGAHAYRAYNVQPDTFESRPSRPKAGPVRPQVQPQPQPSSAMPPQVQSKVQPQIQPQVDVHSEERAAADSSSADVVQLKTETARLNAEVARLSDEASRLRTETARLRNELELREPPASTASVTPTARAPQAGPPPIGAPQADAVQVGKVESGAPAGKIDAKVEPGSAAAAVAPKGDLLISEPRTSEVAKTPPDRKSDAQPLDERAFERQKGVVERAWKQLLDLAGRMKSDASGKPE